jgi:zinc-ribbon domain
MQCSHCGSPLESGAHFCSNCGQAVPIEPPTQQIQPHPPVGGWSPTPPPPPATNGNKGLLYGVIAALVAIIFIGGAIAIFAATIKDSSPTYNTTPPAVAQSDDSTSTLPKKYKKTHKAKKATPQKAAPAPATSAPKSSGATHSYSGFQTPSGNIHCSMTDYLRCDILKNDVVVTKPADCDLDYGNAFSMEFGAGAPYRLCAGDTVASNSTPILAYGEKNTVGVFTCESTTAALICKNTAGSYMSLSRQSQVLR